MSKKENWLIIIAGPNGAGKSTFYNTILRSDPLLKNAPFINQDLFAKELAGDGNPNDYMMKAGRLTCRAIDENIENNKSFVYETTASGLSHLKLMEKQDRKAIKLLLYL